MRSAEDFWGGFSRHYRPVIQNKKLCSTVGMADRRYTPENIAVAARRKASTKTLVV